MAISSQSNCEILWKWSVTAGSLRSERHYKANLWGLINATEAKCSAAEHGEDFSLFPYYIWFVLIHLCNPPSLSGCLSDTIEMIWEERRATMQCDCLHWTLHMHSFRDVVFHACARQPLLPFSTDFWLTSFILIIVEVPVHLVLLRATATQIWPVPVALSDRHYNSMWL